MNRPQAGDAQLAGITQQAVLRRRRLDQALNAKEFDVLAGLSYTTARAWFRLAGFPVVQRRVFWSDFVEWRRRQFEPNKSGINSRPERPNGPRPGLNLDLPPKAARILAEAG
jgi:hypothetical protein